MKEKRLRLFIVYVCILIGILPMTVKADTGPKPSVNVTICGIENEEYYATLLSESRSTGPASVYDGSYAFYQEGDEEYEIWKKFVEYQDSDGFYFLQEFWECTDTDEFRWGYYPPSPFKILLYFPEYDSFVVSEVYERYAFDTYYTVDLTGVDIQNTAVTAVVEAEKNYDYSLELASLAARIVITVLLELAVAWVFAFREKRQLLFLAVVNIITQIILNLLLNGINYKQGQRAFVFYYILLELLVFLIEAAAYSRILPKVSAGAVKRRRATLYALAANLVSFIAGLWIAHLVPGIF